MSRTSRLFQLIRLLRMHRAPVSSDQLADELGVSRRSVYRDIEALRSLGAPIDGQAGVGYVLKKGFFLPDLAFTAEEIDAVILGLGWVRQKADPALVASSSSALAKIMAAGTGGPVLGDDLPGLIAASVSEDADPPHAESLRTAIRHQRKVSITYSDAKGDRSARVVWPLAIVYFDDVRVLAAWCERRSAFRHFRLDRLVLKSILEVRYPESRRVLMKRWQQQDRDWRSMLTTSGTARR